MRSERVLLNELDEAQVTIDSLVRSLEKWKDCPTTKCMCEGCPTLIPFWWVAGLCVPCCREDCEHDDEQRGDKGT